ncbi:MAG: ABC transporter ATP-binding protein [Rhodospirillales bacterium]
MSDPLLTVRDLRTSFATDDGTVLAVDGVDLTLQRGRTLCVVGESGCGKSVMALSIMGLIKQPPGQVNGSIVYDGIDLVALPAKAMRDLRGNRLAMIFQEPMTSLNPVFTIGAQIGEALLRHGKADKTDVRQRVVALLKRVNISAPERRIDEYPHKLSGGMRQRAMIAMALACGPDLLIADEPTTALDVTIQAQILDLLRELRQGSGMSIMLITHDLGVVAELADDVVVMYAGQVVERGSVEDIFNRPQHPYTVGLLGSVPRLDKRHTRLAAIEGSVPNMMRPPSGCRFAARCPFVIAQCRNEAPPLIDVGSDHQSRCWRTPLERLVA